jgi:hypothetical protein
MGVKLIDVRLSATQSADGLARVQLKDTRLRQQVGPVRVQLKYVQLLKPQAADQGWSEII